MSVPMESDACAVWLRLLESSVRDASRTHSQDAEVAAQRVAVLGHVQTLLDAAAQSDRALSVALHRVKTQLAPPLSSSSSSHTATTLGAAPGDAIASTWPRVLNAEEAAALVGLLLAWVARGDDAHWQRVVSAIAELLTSLLHCAVTATTANNVLAATLSAAAQGDASPVLARLLVLVAQLSSAVLAALPWAVLVAAQARLAAVCVRTVLDADAPVLGAALASLERLFAAQHVLLEAVARVPPLVDALVAQHAVELGAWRESVCAVLVSERCDKDLLYLASQLMTRLTLLSHVPLTELRAMLDVHASSRVIAGSVAHTALLRAVALLAHPRDLFSAPAAASLFAHLWHTLVAHCDQSVDRYQRFVAFQGLDACLQQRLSVSNVASLSEEAVHVDVEEDRMLVDATLALFMRHWEDAMDAVVSQIRSSFRTLLRVYDASALAHSDAQLVPRLAQELLALSDAVKGKYALLAVLVERLGVDALFALQPTLLAQLYHAVCAHRSLAPQIARFHEQLLKALLAEHGADMAEARVREALTPLLLSATLRDEGWQSLAQYILPALCTLLGSAVWPALVQHVMAAQCRDDERPTEPHTWQSARLRAVLSLTQLARAQGVAYPDAEAHVRALVLVGMVHGDAEVRHSALELICTTHKKSEAPTASDLAALRYYVRVALDDDSVRHREPRVQCVRRLLTRLHDSARKLLKLRDAASQRAIAGAVHAVNALAQLLAAQLYPGASSVRVCNALDLLYVLCDVFVLALDPLTAAPWERAAGSAFALASPLVVHALLHVLSDAHVGVVTHVRSRAARVLLLLRAPLSALPDADSVGTAFTRALAHVAAPRALEAEAGVWQLRTLATLYVLRVPASGGALRLRFMLCENEPARLACVAEAGGADVASVSSEALGLCTTLHRWCVAQLTAWERDVVAAARERVSLHGPLAALRAVLLDALQCAKSEAEAWQPLVRDVMALAVRVCRVLRIYTHPITFREACGGDFGAVLGSAAQLVTVCSWHAVHEALDLLTALVCDVAHVSLRGAERDAAAVLEAAAQCVLDTMLRVIHKGIAEHEAPLLRLASLVLSDARFGRAPVERWLRAVLDAIGGHHTFGALVNTRRSAGLPHAVRALLAAEARITPASRALQRLAMETLLTYAREDADETACIHALNTLRGVLLDKRVFEDLAPYLEPCLHTLFRAYRSASWGVRNSATLTFSALVQRYTGLKNPGLTRRIKSTKGVTVSDVCARHPNLVAQLEAELRASPHVDTVRVDSAVFAALVFLSALLPARAAGPLATGMTTQLLSALLPLASSASWHVRNMVALATLPLLPTSGEREFVRGVLQDLKRAFATPLSANAVHGLLLILRHVRVTLDATRPADLELAHTILSELASVHARVALLHAATPVSALYLALLRKYAKFLLAAPTPRAAHSAILDAVAHLACDLVQRILAETPASLPLRYMVQTQVLALALAITARTQPLNAALVQRLLASPHPELREKLLRHTLTPALHTLPALKSVLASYLSANSEPHAGCRAVMYTHVDLLADALEPAQAMQLAQVLQDVVSARGAPALRAAALRGSCALVRARFADNAGAQREYAHFLADLLAEEDLPLEVAETASTILGPSLCAVHALPDVAQVLWTRGLVFILNADAGIQADAVASVSSALGAPPLSLPGFLLRVFEHLSRTVASTALVDIVFDSLAACLKADAQDLDSDREEDEEEGNEEEGDEGAQSTVFAKDASSSLRENAFVVVQAALAHLLRLQGDARAAMQRRAAHLFQDLPSSFQTRSLQALMSQVGIHSRSSGIEDTDQESFEKYFFQDVIRGKQTIFESSI